MSIPSIHGLPASYDEWRTREPDPETMDASDCMFEASCALKKAQGTPKYELDKRRALLNEAKDWIEIAEEKL